MTAFGCLNLGHLHANTGRETDARRHHMEALEAGRALGSARLEALASLGLAQLAAVGGVWDEVERYATRARDLARPQADRSTARAGSYFLAIRALRLDRDEEAEHQAALGLSERVDSQPTQGLLEMCRAVALARLGRPVEAAAALEAIGHQPIDGWFTEVVVRLRPLIEAILTLRRAAGDDAELALARLVRLTEAGPVDSTQSQAPFYAVARTEVERARGASVSSGMSGTVRAPPTRGQRRS